MNYTKFYVISRTCMIVFYYILLSVIDESFNPFKWNDAVNFMCIGLYLGMFVDMIASLNRFHND